MNRAFSLNSLNLVWQLNIRSCAFALVMAVILVVVYTNGLRGFSGIVIGAMAGLDISYLAHIRSINEPF